MREILTGVIFSVVAFGIFFVFVAVGFPGSPDTCLTEPSLWHASDSCYCEYFNPAQIGMPWPRQPINTWGNFMGLVYGAIVAWGIYSVRTGGNAGTTNKMRTTSLYPLTYLCVVIFLGLGSMWFHASMVHWASAFDLLSMFMFVIYILLYSFVRMVPGAWFWLLAIVYWVLVLLLTILDSALSLNSALIILPVIVIAAVFEIIALVRNPDIRPPWQGYLVIGLGALSFGLAFLFWILSQSGGPLCFPHGFQGHTLWHWLAGVTSISFYFYWRWLPRSERAET
jgi:ceramidase